MRLLITFLSLILLLPSLIVHAEESPASNVMIVLDASGSMWGQIEGTPKISIARTVIQDLIGGWDSNVSIGLTVYGHRKKGDCGDIELLIPVGTLDQKAFMSAVNGLQPKGKTPLSQAVKNAAQAMRFEEDKATVILVTDGKETCNLDPCTVGTELESLGVDFTAHVIGFDVKPEEQADLQCLAENTGGIFIPASSAGELKDALGKTVVAAKKVSAGVRLQAVVEKGQEPLEKGLSWDIYEAGQLPDGSYRKVTYSYNAQPFLSLASGEYRAKVTWGNTTGYKEFSVKTDEAATHTIVLGAGTLRTTVVFKEGMEPITSSTGWDVYEVKTDIEGKRKKVAYSYNHNPLFKLPSGDYLVTVKVGDATHQKEVSVIGGELTEQVLILNAGKARFSAILTEGEQPLAKGLGWDFYAPADIQGKRKKASYSYDATPVITLPAGSYTANVTYGNASTALAFEVTAGELTESTLSLNAGSMRISAVAVEGGDKLSANLGWDVYHAAQDISGKRKKAGYSYNAAPLFTVPAGSYLVTLSSGAAKATLTVDVEAGKFTEHTVDLNAGTVEIVAIDAPSGTEFGKVSWDIYHAAEDVSGKRKKAGYSYNAKARFFLPAGRYRVEGNAGGKMATIEIEVKAGTFSQQQLIIE